MRLVKHLVVFDGGSLFMDSIPSLIYGLQRGYNSSPAECSAARTAEFSHPAVFQAADCRQPSAA